MVEGALRLARPASGARGLRAHPPAPLVLRTLFFTEMWGMRERCSDCGMRALPARFMVDAIENDGLGMDARTATAVYGLCTDAHG